MSTTSHHRPHRATNGAVKRFGYLIILTVPILPWLGLAIWREVGHADLLAWTTFFYFFGLIPIIDRLVGKDDHNPDEANIKTLADDRFYRRLTYLAVPMLSLSLIAGAYGLAHFDVLGPVGQIGWVVSHGLIGGVLGINVAHELIHKNTRIEKRLGDFLLAIACYPGFRIEHIYGHHRHVSTPLDRSSARFGQSLFHFLPRAMAGNVIAAFRLETARLQRQDKRLVSVDNELLLGYAVVLALAVALTAAFGLPGLVFFFGQGIVSIITLETVNYLEHYGLERRLLPNGRYERTNHTHSWNSNFLLTNMLLFQLQRHADHHENPTRRYQTLRHFDESPQLPAGYATMMMLAWCPPLWHKVMDPRVMAYYDGEPPNASARPVSTPHQSAPSSV